MKIFQSRADKKETRVVIDGREFTGRDITINANGTVVIDGKRQDGTLVGPVNVQIYGPVSVVETVSGDVTVEGSVGSAQTVSGDIKVAANIHGNVSTVSGDVIAGCIDVR